MLRQPITSARLCFKQSIRRLSASSTVLSGPPRNGGGILEEEHQEARAWLAKFNINTIPKEICEVNFSRASGPGGQNVNKVNSKATLRLKTKVLLPLIPKVLWPEIVASRYHAKNSDTMVIQGDGSRSQSENVQECYKKLHALVVATGKIAVRGKTSPAQMERVKSMQRKENETRLRSKKTHGTKKAERKGLSKSDY